MTSMRNESILMIVIAVLVFALALSGCTKTYETTITAEKLCAQYEDQQVSGDLRDKHDECLLFRGEEVSEKVQCKDMCRKLCVDNNKDYLDSWADFAGCHCSCSLKIVD